MHWAETVNLRGRVGSTALEEATNAACVACGAASGVLVASGVQGASGVLVACRACSTSGPGVGGGSADAGSRRGGAKASGGGGSCGHGEGSFGAASAAEAGVNRRAGRLKRRCRMEISASLSLEVDATRCTGRDIGRPDGPTAAFPTLAHRGAFTGRAEGLAVLAAWHRGGARRLRAPAAWRASADAARQEFTRDATAGRVRPVGEASPDRSPTSLAERSASSSVGDLLACYALLGAALDTRAAGPRRRSALTPQSLRAVGRSRAGSRRREPLALLRPPGPRANRRRVGPLTDDDARTLRPCASRERR